MEPIDSLECMILSQKTGRHTQRQMRLEKGLGFCNILQQ